LKEIKVYFSEKFSQDYNILIADVKKDKDKGIKNSHNFQLLKAIDRTIDILKLDPDYGVNIPKNLIPKKYVNELGINNLRKVDLPSYWRLCYTLKADSFEVISVLLEFMDHNVYNKRFGYKKR